MRIKYMGPNTRVNVPPYGIHLMMEEKDYPDDFGKNLLATSSKQVFEEVEASAKKKGKKEASKP